MNQHFTYEVNDGRCDPSVRIDEGGEPYFWVEVDAIDQLIETLREAKKNV
jgi:hypothetical protein